MRGVVKMGWPRVAITAVALTAASMTVIASPPTAAASAGASKQCRSADDWRDPLRLYGRDIQFSVVRNGDPIGTHRVTFDRRDDVVVADSRLDIRVKVLMVTAYRFLYTSTDVWQDGCLVALNAMIDDNGKTKTIRAEKRDGGLTVVGPEGTQAGPSDLFPTNHWNAGVIGSNRVIDTLKGTVANVRIADRGVETVIAGGRKQQARRFAYTGDVETEVWYDDAGRWLKMRFIAQDGSVVEYICERCGLAGDGRA